MRRVGHAVVTASSPCVQPSARRCLSSGYGDWVRDRHDASGGLSVFGDYAKEYDAGRPHYPASFFDDCRALVATYGNAAADVCAGTGRGASELVARGFAPVVAVDADRCMLACVADPRIRTIHTDAADTTLSDASVDLVLCLQAFHWLDDADTALREFARILRPRTGAAVVAWNDRDLESCAFLAEFEGLVERANPRYHRGLKSAERYEEDLSRCPHLFGPFNKRVYDNDTPTDTESFVRQTRTFSYVRNALGEQETERFEADVRELIRTHFGEGDGEVGGVKFTQKWKTKAYFLRRL